MKKAAKVLDLAAIHAINARIPLGAALVERPQHPIAVATADGVENGLMGQDGAEDTDRRAIGQVRIDSSPVVWNVLAIAVF